MLSSVEKRSQLDVTVYCGADAKSDHYLVSAMIELKLKREETQEMNNKRTKNVKRGADFRCGTQHKMRQHKKEAPQH